MMPNVDPRTLRNMMAKMGIKSSEIEAESVIINCPDRQIIINEPQVTQIEAQGVLSFQIAGSVEEKPKEQPKADITEEDVKLVMDRTGNSDAEAVRKALEDNNGDIAATILKLGGQS